MQTSKVKEILSTKEWKWPNGTVRFYTMEMEDGNKVNIGKKSDNAFVVGDELTYTITEVDEYGVKKIKEVKDAPQQTQRSTQKEGWKEKYVSFAASYAKDVLVANPNFKMSEFGAIATEILNWMIDKHDSLNSK